MTTTTAKVDDVVRIKDEQLPHEWVAKVYEIVAIHGVNYAVLSPMGSFLLMVNTREMGKTIEGWIVYEHDIIKEKTPGDD
jgi:hypothetical protein